MSDESRVRVGILGTGNIANSFAEGLSNAADLELVAVGSRTRKNAERFADLHGINEHYSSYDDLVADPKVDLVYIATPHSHHQQHSLLRLEAGKAVLCEKPFAINASEAQMVVDCARDLGLFLMEAMWSRFLPAFVKLRELLAEDVIGPVQLVIAGGGFQPERGSDHYLWKPELGGGVLLDAGVYPVSLTSMMLGPPTQVKAFGTVGEYDVDEQDTMLLSHDGGTTAMLYVSLNTSFSPDITIMGTSGRIYVHPPMFAPSRIDIHVQGEDVLHIDCPIVGNGYHYQAVAAAAAMHAGKTESDVMPLDETISIMRTLDEIRGQVGLRYPVEQQ